MNNVIVIGREFGSGGREFARRLAEKLGYQYYDNEILTQIVKHTELSESYVNDIVENQSSILFPITVEHTFTFGCDYNLQQVQDIYRAQTDVIREMATKSNCVIVGRCADYILKDVEEISLFSIFIHADLEARIQRCIDKAQEGENMDYKAMKKFIQKIDKGRASYYEDYTLQEWGAKENYDMCINTTDIDIAEAVEYFAKIFQ